MNKPSEERVDRVTLQIWEPSGVNRKDWPVTVGVPSGRGMLGSEHDLSLWDGSEELRICSRVTASWPDGSVRWVLLDFHVDLLGNQKKGLMLRFGDDEACSVKPAATLAVTEKGKEITIENGDLRVVFRPGGRLPFDELWYKGESLVQGGAGLCELVEKGERYSARGQSVRFEIEEANDLRTVVRGEGTFVGEDGSTSLDLTTRVYAYSGKSFVRLFHTVINKTGGSVDLSELTFSLPVAACEPNASSYITAHGLDGSIHSAVDGQISLSAKVVPVPVTEYHRDRLRGHVPPEAAEKAHGWMESREADEMELRSGDRPPVALAGERRMFPVIATAVLCSKNRLVALGCRDFYGQAPKKLSVKDGRIELDLCRDFGDGPLELWRGTAKTHEVHVVLGPGSDLEQEDEIMAYKRTMLALQEPLAPTYGDSDWLQRTGVVGPIFPYRPREYPWLEFVFRRLFETWFEGKEWFPEDTGSSRGSSFLNFGDYWNPGRGGQWQNNEMDHGGGMLLFMLRTGYPKPFPSVEASIHHMIDVDTHHEAANPLWVGAQRYHQVFHGAYCSPTLCHQWLEGPLYYYLYTGYERAREVAFMRAEHFCAMIEGGAHRVKQLERVQGWPLVALSTMNDYFPNQRYVKACEAIMDWLEQWKSEDGDLVYPYMWKIVEGEQGGSILGRGVMGQALAHYHRMTGDERAWRLLLESMEAAKDKVFTAEGHGTKTSLLRRNYYAPGESDFVLEALGYLWEQTGDEEWMRLGILNFKLALFQRGALGEGRPGWGTAEPYRHWPPFLYYAHKSGMLEDVKIL